MVDFKEFKLGDVCSRLSSGKNISSSLISETNSFPVYGGNGLRGYTDSSNFVGECAIVGRQGAFCGNVRFFSGEAYMTEHAVVICANEMNNTHYLAYLLSRMDLGRLSGQSAQPGLSVKTLGNQIVKLPSLDYQRKVVAILSSFDKKIEQSIKINNNLFEQAITIFDSMFPNVSRGKYSIGDYISPKRGKNLLSKDAVAGNIPVVAGGLEPSTYHNVANTKAPVLAISASGANAGYVSLWHTPIWSSDSSFIDSSMTDNVFFWYVLLKKRQKEIFDAQTGSAQPHIYPQHIAAMSITELNNCLVKDFTRLVTPLFNAIGENTLQNQQLSSLRDALLPKLMSGELDITTLEI